MIPIIMDTNFNRLGMIDDYISFIWTNRYYASGDFELCTPISDKCINLLKKDYYIARDDDESIGVIENIKFTKIDRLTDAEEMIVVRGRFLPSILSRRIIATQTQVKGSVASCIQTLINQNAISPSIAARKIPNLTFKSTVTSTRTMEQQFTGKNLLTTIEDICLEYGLGYKVTLDESNNFAFELYEGVNRSYDQNENPFVVFSHDYDNLESSDYEEDYQAIVTDVLVAGEGEGTARKMIWANKKTNSGLARYEIFQDARNASTNNGAISDNVYYEQLKNEGLESITKYTQAFAGKVYFGNVEYGKDINLGDICTVENTAWGIYINTRLIEMIESTNEAGEYTITPTFGV